MGEAGASFRKLEARRGEGEVRGRLARFARGVEAGDGDAAGGGRAQAGDAFEHGGLARLGGTDERDDFPRRYVEVEGVEHRAAAVNERELSDGEHIRWRQSGGGRRP